MKLTYARLLDDFLLRPPVNPESGKSLENSARRWIPGAQIDKI